MPRRHGKGAEMFEVANDNIYQCSQCGSRRSVEFYEPAKYQPSKQVKVRQCRDCKHEKITALDSSSNVNTQWTYIKPSNVINVINF